MASPVTKFARLPLRVGASTGFASVDSNTLRREVDALGFV
jgi:hypothetical protein